MPIHIQGVALKNRPAEYDALTVAALDARDALRDAIPRLDAALAIAADGQPLHVALRIQGGISATTPSERKDIMPLSRWTRHAWNAADNRRSVDGVPAGRRL